MSRLEHDPRRACGRPWSGHPRRMPGGRPERADDDGEERHEPRAAAGDRGDAGRERVTEHGHPTWVGMGWSEGGRLTRTESCTPAAARRRLSYDGPVPEPLATRRFMRFRARDPSFPRPSV